MRKNPYQDEIGIAVYGGDGNALLLITRGQNKRVERIVCCARVADFDLPIHSCGRYLNQIAETVFRYIL